MSSATTRPGWRSAGVAITAVLLMVAFAYQQTLIYLTSLWNEVSVGEYAHGYLVLAISAYLIIVNRKRLAAIPPCPVYWALPVVLAASLLWLVAVLVDVEMLESVGLLFIVFSISWAVLGVQAMRVLAFPILFIVFAIPVWFPLSPVLQNVTADVVFWMIRVLHVPAFRVENMIVVPAGMLSVEEACSGLRYLLAALTLGALYAYINYSTLAARIIVVLVAASMAVLSNIVRVFIVVYLGYSTDMQHPLVSDHLMLGWYLFGGMVAVLLFLDARLYKRRMLTAEATISADRSPVRSCEKKRIHVVVITLLCIIVLLVGPAVAYQQKNQQYPSASQYNIYFPVDVEGWLGPENSNNDWMPNYAGAVSLKRDYQQSEAGERTGAGDLSLYVAYYPVQQQGVEVINDLNRISNNKLWKRQYSRPRIRKLADHDVMEQLLLDNRGQRRLVWYWYNVSGRVTVNKYEAKLLQLFGVLVGEPQAYMIAVSMPVVNDEDRVRQLMAGFVATVKSLSDLNVENKN